MELTELQGLLTRPDELTKAIVAEKTEAFKIEDIKKQYDPKGHAITDKMERPDKLVVTEVLGKDTTSTVKVARLPIPMQKRIVRLAATFLCGRPIELISAAAEGKTKDLLTVLTKTWKDNKLDYRSKKLAKLMMSETECAEIWYVEKAEDGFWTGTPNEKLKGTGNLKLRMKMLAPSLGDKLYPVYNAAGDMIAFGRGFTTTSDGKKLECFDLYTAENFYYFQKGSSNWEPRNATAQNGTTKPVESNPYKKIPVIYYNQDSPEWNDVQELIERFEISISNHADTNDYHGSPTIKVKGTVAGFAKKGEQGKIIQLEGADADANYMSWDKSPDSVKLEQENLLNLIYSLTDTPNISFEQMKGLGTFSGIALKMLFLGAHMKASDHEENFGESIQRRINYLKAALAIINTDLEEAVPVSIEPRFTYFLPKNEQEIIEMLTTATTGGIMSKKTAVSQNPFVEDPDAEETLLKEEANSAGALDNLMQ